MRGGQRVIWSFCWTTVLLLWGIFLSAPFNVSATATGNSEKLEEMANRLTKEIFEANWQLAWMEQEKERLLAELKKLEQQLAGQEEDLAGLLAAGAAKRDQLADWLRFAFIYNSDSFFLSIFQAKNITDLLIHWYLFEKIVTHQANLINEVFQAQAQILKHRLGLTEAKTELTKNIDQLALLEKGLVALVLERQEALESARRAEQEYGLNIFVQEQYWTQLVNSLEELLAVFQALDWQALEPKRVELNLRQRKAVAEFGQEDIAGIIRRNKLGAEFRLKITEEGMLLIREADQTISFLTGLDVFNNKLLLKPRKITIGGISLSDQLVQQLIHSYNLTAPLPEVEPGVTAGSIMANNGFISVEFKLK